MSRQRHLHDALPSGEGRRTPTAVMGIRLLAAILTLAGGSYTVNWDLPSRNQRETMATWEKRPLV
jgi:hypothetical protein